MTAQWYDIDVGLLVSKKVPAVQASMLSCLRAYSGGLLTFVPVSISMIFDSCVNLCDKGFKNKTSNGYIKSHYSVSYTKKYVTLLRGNASRLMIYLAFF